MSIWQIIRRLVPFIKPHGRWVALSLALTLIAACAAQVNPVVLRYTVDTIEGLLREGRTASQGASLLALAIMFSANLYVGLVAAAILPVYFLLSQRQASMLRGARRALRALREEKNNGLHNIIESIVVIKSFVREEYEKEKQVRLQQNLVRAQLKQRQTNFVFDGLKTFVEQIGVVLIIILTAYLVLGGRMSIGAIMFHIMLFGNVSAPIRQLHRIYDEMNDALTYAEGYFQILDADSETETGGTLGVSNLRGSFELLDVSFTYPNGTQALHHVNMKIPHGKRVAFVGLSGAGKSTLLNLLTRFYAPTSGRILLDGRELAEYKTDLLRRKIGLVLQKNHIFKGTIEENIRYGKINAPFADVAEAARKAYLHEQIQNLPNGYGSEAHLLSGGQQQRIAIARLF